MAMSCSIEHRCSSDLVLPWLWCRLQKQLGSCIAWLWDRPAAAVLIGPLAWELPYTAHAALKRKRKKKKKKTTKTPHYIAIINKITAKENQRKLGGKRENSRASSEVHHPNDRNPEKEEIKIEN